MSRKYTNAGFISVKYFARTGEFRPPKAGEYYLSGAIPTAWYTRNSLDTPYHILKRVPDPPKTITRNGFVYRLQGVVGGNP